MFDPDSDQDVKELVRANECWDSLHPTHVTDIFQRTLLNAIPRLDRLVTGLQNGSIDPVAFDAMLRLLHWVSKAQSQFIKDGIRFQPYLGMSGQPSSCQSKVSGQR